MHFTEVLLKGIQLSQATEVIIITLYSHQDGIKSRILEGFCGNFDRFLKNDAKLIHHSLGLF